MTKLYEEPFEKRIRVKYFLFGLILGLTILALLISIGSLGGYLVRTYFPELVTVKDPTDIALNQSMIGLPFLLFIPLLYLMWNSKNKSKSVEHETLGLKYDWEQVKHERN